MYVKYNNLYMSKISNIQVRCIFEIQKKMKSKHYFTERLSNFVIIQ